MEQDYYLSSQNEETELSEEPITKKFDAHIGIFTLQGVVCIGIIVFLLIIKIFFGDFFGEIKNWYQSNANQDTDLSLVLENNLDQNGVGGPLQTLNVSSGFETPVLGVTTSNYGYRTDPFTGTISLHSGVDIAAKQGTDINAVLGGVVEFAKNTTGDYGNYIIINHGGIKTLYAHCLELNVAKGDTIEKGQTIATVGSTGRSTGPHLHFELRVDNKPIDPSPFIFIENK